MVLVVNGSLGSRAMLRMDIRFYTREYIMGPRNVLV